MNKFVQFTKNFGEWTVPEACKVKDLPFIKDIENFLVPEVEIFCCYIECPLEARWEIIHGSNPTVDDYTHSCDRHIAELLADADQHILRPLFEQPPSLSMTLDPKLTQFSNEQIFEEAFRRDHLKWHKWNPNIICSRCTTS